jgi:putrescine transport system permease protein
MNKGLSWFVLILMLVGYLFLYGPILSLIVYSFNVSKLVTVWGGFSFKWYGVLAQDDAIIRAVKLSFLIAAVSATAAAILGTMAGYVLARFRRFKGRLVFTGMVSAPLVMPEVITGLSMLLLFVSMEQLIGWPAGRGKVTIILAHTTFCLTYVAVILQARLSQLDQSLEEAALDRLPPAENLLRHPLPIIAGHRLGLAAGLTLSLDDVVISSHHGPGATTLPMEVFSRVRLGLNPEIIARHHYHRRGGLGDLIASIFMSRQESAANATCRWRSQRTSSARRICRAREKVSSTHLSLFRRKPESGAT